MGCELCENAGGEILWEDDFCRAVWAYEPDHPGLCRVIWDRHVKEMTDLKSVERERLMRVVFAVEAGIDHRPGARTRSMSPAWATACRTSIGTSSRGSETTRIFPTRSGARNFARAGTRSLPTSPCDMRKALDEILKPRGLVGRS